MKAIIGLLVLVGIVYLLTKKKKKTAVVQKAAVVQKQVAEQKKNMETHKVAGISYRKDAVMSFAVENEYYNMTKKQIIDGGMEDAVIYKYEFPDLPAEFVFEPDNEYDPNAIAIYVEGKKIGYVKKGSTAHIRNLINAGKIKSALCRFSGGPSKFYDSVEEELQKNDDDFGAKITLTLNEDPEG